MSFRALFLLFAFLLVPAFAQAQTPAPRCTMTVAPATINKGGSVTLKWTSTNATAANIPGPGLGNVAVNGQKNLIPIGSTRWTGTFTGPGGKTTCSATVVVLDGGNSMMVLPSDDPSYGAGSSDPVGAPGTVQPGGNVQPGGTVQPGGAVQGGGEVQDPGTVNGAGSVSGPEGGIEDPGTVQAPGTVSAPGSLNGPGSFPGSAPASGNRDTTINNSAGSGLVPCDGINCQACHLATLAQKIVNFLIGLTIPLAAVLFAWAGVLYFSSSVVNKIDKARKIFTTVLIGFGIAVASWLIVQTLLATLLNASYKNWNVIQCVGQENRRTNVSPDEWLRSISVLNTIDTSTQRGMIPPASYPVLNGVSYNPVDGCAYGSSWNSTYQGCVNADGDMMPPTGFPPARGYQQPGSYATCYGSDALENGLCQGPEGMYPPHQVSNSLVGPEGSCKPGYRYAEDAEYAWCQGPGGSEDWEELQSSASGSTSGLRGVAQCASSNTNCSVEELMALGLTRAQANVMSCVAITENAGNAVGCSGTGPCGTFQISRTNWGLYAPSDCSAANFSGNITAAQNHAECNKRTMVNMVQKLGYQPWTGNHPGQAPWNPKAITCANNYAAL